MHYNKKSGLKYKDKGNLILGNLLTAYHLNIYNKFRETFNLKYCHTNNVLRNFAKTRT